MISNGAYPFSLIWTDLHEGSWWGSCGSWDSPWWWRNRRSPSWARHNLVGNRWPKIFEVKMDFEGCCHSSVDSSAPSILSPHVRVPSTSPTLLWIYILIVSFWKDKKTKRGRDWPIFKKNVFWRNWANPTTWTWLIQPFVIIVLT